MRRPLLALVVILWASSAAAQAVSHSGFVDGRLFGFPQAVPNDTTRIIGDALFRNEIVLRPADWFQFAAGLDLRANSHDQVEDRWRLDFEDRGVRRPRAAVRRLAATVAARGFTLDAGKQFIRWGRADIIYPTDRFAPRDFLNVIDSDLLPVIGARASVQIGSETLEAVWVPQLTPSRLPLLDQRWAAVPPEASPFRVADGGSEIPRGSQYGARWRHTRSRVETALSFFDGFNHLPDIDVRPQSDPGAIDIVRVFPAIRMYGGDIALPSGWLTLKAEAAYLTSPSSTSDEYLLYVIEGERQTGEWLFDVGYAGEVVRQSRVPVVFSPDRNMARSVIGRASYTVDPRRTVVIEGAARQSGDGFYAKVQYSQAMTQHWHLTLTGVSLAGDPGDFLGQYRRNSHGSVALRFSY
jgi:hypothetical protein